ncbi:methyltransferase domain-containing protein [Brevundimonas sp.]|jgi:SAM-dependent methyltransferase|uniref:methyltransferase domain-containing protein n=1 Tax=Brevundimonas sp. TaxID=1871086 RepID=UPI002E10BF58|nr:methyltransferase domain-containing protein [Brevundimonas sp.]
MTPPRPIQARLFDPARRAARLERSRPLFAGADFLHRRAALGLVESLEAILRDFPAVVDLSPHPRAFAEALAASDAAGRVGSPRTVAAPMGPEDLELEPASVDLIVSVLGLQWVEDLPGLMVRARRALKPDGLFLAALLGGSTLTELRQALTAAELEITDGAATRVSPFADGFDGAALLQRAGLALPVCDVDRVTVRYGDPIALMKDLRAMGETAVPTGPVRPLRRDVLLRAAQIYAERFADADGKLTATFEIVTLSGWAPHEGQQRPLSRGSATVRLADALGVVEHKGE